MGDFEPDEDSETYANAQNETEKPRPEQRSQLEDLAYQKHLLQIEKERFALQMESFKLHKEVSKPPPPPARLAQQSEIPKKTPVPETPASQPNIPVSEAVKRQREWEERQLPPSKRSRASSSPRRSRSPLRRGHVRDLSPLGSPYRRLIPGLKPGSAKSSVRRSRSLSPQDFDLESDHQTKLDGQFRPALKLLLHTKEELDQASHKVKTSAPKHFGLFRQAKRDKILLPPHDYIQESFDFAHESVKDGISKGKGSSAYQFEKGVPFQPTSLWSRSGMFDSGTQGEYFSCAAKSLDPRAMELFTFKDSDSFHKTMEYQLPLSKKASQTIEKNVKHSIASTSYGFHFLDGVKEMSQELRGQLRSTSKLLGRYETVRCQVKSRPQGHSRQDGYIPQTSHSRLLLRIGVQRGIRCNGDTVSQRPIPVQIGSAFDGTCPNTAERTFR